MAQNIRIMFDSKTDFMFAIFIFSSIFISYVLSVPTFGKLPLPSPGPVCLAFDSRGGGPYTGIDDGRIVKYMGEIIGFEEFAYTSPNRSKDSCDEIKDRDLATCGRPVGVGFDDATGQLYITDVTYGLLVVGQKGGLATQLASEVEGVPLRAPDSVEVDHTTGNVYFTDPSSIFGYSQFDKLLSVNDSTGRLMKYDPKTKKVSVVLRCLSGPSGVTISKDGSFLLFTEYQTNRIKKYWLRGPKANTVEILVYVNGSPDKIRRTTTGDFWIGINFPSKTLIPQSQLRGVRINQHGEILETLIFSPRLKANIITEIHEHGGTLFLGSGNAEYIGVYRH